ncbi:MAG TPA: glycosyltransferase family 4 protein [Solirubrobacter sp.]|nr:glycosyltransferase family 4 protein [Solirubrobacter sp.]
MARIALVCEPPDGGAAEHVAQLARGLGAYGHEAVVFAPRGFAPAVDFVPLPFRRDYAHPQDDARSLATLIRAARGFDLVHAHSAKAGVLARLAALAAVRPAVYTPHGFPFVGDMREARRVFSRVAERALAPSTAAIIAVCEFERDLARAEKLRPARIAVVHNGSPPCDAPPRPPGGLTVGTVSALRRGKGVDVFLAAAPRILEAVPDAQLVVTGDGPLRDELKRAADPRVRFEPYRPPAHNHLKALDVYVLASSWEAFPIGPLEALACGVPQVVTAVGGTREAVTGQTGLLIPPKDPDALAQAVIELLKDPQRRARMQHASRERHARRFTVDRMVAGTAAVYDAVLSTRRGR